MSDNKINPNLVGSLWQRQSKNGMTYFSGIINGEKVVVFPPREKKSDKSPDWIIWKDKPREQQQPQVESWPDFGPQSYPQTQNEDIPF